MYVTPFGAYKDTPSRWGMEDLAGVDRNRAAKQVAKGTALAVNVGNTAVQGATGTGGLAMALGTAAVSATGVGLVAAGGVLTVGSCVYAARSAYKTYQHREVLLDLERRKGGFNCKLIPMTAKHPDLVEGFPPNRTEHNTVCDEVLPYIIAKKKAKLIRKGGSIVPGGGLVDGLYGAGKKGFKWFKGTLGVNRTNAARWLAVHLITHKCEIAEAIVAELYSLEECQILKTFNSDKLIPYLMDKMKSN
jgi:hypothetical protein